MVQTVFNAGSIPAVHDFATGAGNHGGECRLSERLLQEPHRPVGEQAVGPAGVHAVNLPLVGAVDGARPAADEEFLFLIAVDGGHEGAVAPDHGRRLAVAG